MRWGRNPQQARREHLKRIKRQHQENMNRNKVKVRNIINGEEFSFEITKREYRRYQAEVKKVNKKRERMLKEIDKHLDEGVKRMEEIMRETTPHQGVNVVRFIPSKVVPLERLRSKVAFERQLERLREESSYKLFNKKAEIYRDNLIRAIEDRFKGQGKKLEELVKQLNPSQLQWLLLRHPGDFSIGYVYEHDPDLSAAVLERLVNFVEHALSLDLKLGV